VVLEVVFGIRRSTGGNDALSVTALDPSEKLVGLLSFQIRNSSFDSLLIGNMLELLMEAECQRAEDRRYKYEAVALLGDNSLPGVETTNHSP